jgi:hypothetical protein
MAARKPTKLNAPATMTAIQFAQNGTSTPSKVTDHPSQSGSTAEVRSGIACGRSPVRAATSVACRRDRECGRTSARPFRREAASRRAQHRISTEPGWHRRRFGPPRRHASANSRWLASVLRSAFSRRRHPAPSVARRRQRRRVARFVNELRRGSSGRRCADFCRYTTERYALQFFGFALDHFEV